VLCALEPEATAERRAQLMIEAKSQVRVPVMYFDVTFSVSKSITLLHASALANSAKAEVEGDQEAVAYWELAAAEVWECVEAGNRAALEYLQREAGYTRSGYHGRETDGVRTGRWEDAHGFIVGSFTQHTSRDGDPQLHIHNLVLNRVMRERDGAYRTLDSQALYEHDVYALTTSQAARNILHDAGVELADNTAVFLGHLVGQREARGTKTVRSGTLLLLDEASMMSMADMAAIMRQAAERNCRVLITGDHEQLAAVEGGGGMMMLLRRMGYVQLPEPVRFTHEWERDATLRLRMGDATVLAQYEEQARVRGGDTEEAMDLACRAWTADHLAGKDTLLLARTEEQARELSRRIRDDLIRYGLVWTARSRVPPGSAASAAAHSWCGY
jgi:hypothetical protein